MALANLSERIKIKLSHQGLSTAAFEKKAGLKPGAVNNILYGRSKNPTISIIQSIASAFECRISDLIDDDFSSAGDEKLNNFLSSDTTPWNQELYIQSFEYAVTLIRSMNISCSKTKLLDCVEEIYRYSNKGQSATVDKRFSEWLIEKMIS